MKYVNFKALDAVTSEENHESDVIDTSQVFRISAQIVASAGTVTGEVQLQVSNDPILVGYEMLAEPTNWSDLGSPVTLSGEGTYVIASQDICYRALRVVFTSASGSDTSLVTVNLMGLAI